MSKWKNDCMNLTSSIDTYYFVNSDDVEVGGTTVRAAESVLRYTRNPFSMNR